MESKNTRTYFTFLHGDNYTRTSSICVVVFYLYFFFSFDDSTQAHICTSVVANKVDFIII